MSQQIIAQPIDDSYEEWEIILPDYSRGFVEDIKAHIPADHRTWNPVSKCWVVTDRWREHALEIALQYWKNAEVVVRDVE